MIGAPFTGMQLRSQWRNWGHCRIITFLKISILQTPSPYLLQDLEERQQQILDADYSNVDIDALVNALSISPKSKQQLKATIKKFPILFGGGLGLLKNQTRHYWAPERCKSSIPKSTYRNPWRKKFTGCAKNQCWKIVLWWWFCLSISHIWPTQENWWHLDPNWLQEHEPSHWMKVISSTTNWRNHSKTGVLPFCYSTGPVPMILPNPYLQKKPKDLHHHSSLGKYAYQMLPTAVACAPDIFQSIMMDLLLGNLPFVLVCIDDILIIQQVGETEEDHLLKVRLCFKNYRTKAFKPISRSPSSSYARKGSGVPRIPTYKWWH